MDETTRSDTHADTTGAAPPKSRGGVPWSAFIVLLVIAFAAGFLWQYYEASTARQQLTAVEQELEVERLRVRLGQAALAASAGDFETARTRMSTFFTQLQERSPTLPAEVGGVAESFLDRRDEVITGLSRSNPEYAIVLYGMAEELGTAIGQSRGEPPAGPPADGTGGGQGPGTEDPPVEPGTTATEPSG